MNACEQILPGIKKIGWVECSRLPRQIAMAGLSRLTVPIPADINFFSFFGSPECSRTTEKENNGLVQSASLKFVAAEELPYERHIAFIVVDANGKNYVIGSHEKPYPVVKIEKTAGSPDGSAAGYLHEITHKAIRTLVPCII